jgi:hypothetical protein
MGAALVMAGLAFAEPVGQNIDSPTAIDAQNQAAVRTRNTRRKSERIVCPHEDRVARNTTLLPESLIVSPLIVLVWTAFG